MTTIEAEQIKKSDRVVVGHHHHHHVNKVIKKRRCQRRVGIQFRSPPTTLQKLFDSCRQVFNGPGTVPSTADVQKLSQILDNMKPEDVGLSRDLQFFKQHDSEIEVTPRVTSATIYKCDNFELCIFFLPATGVIPLHNHPEMTVFSKLLLGSMHIKAYDWVNTDTSGSRPNLGLAKIKANKVFTAPCDTSVLYPTSGGNIHEFRAITPCAVLDVIGPPYCKDDGRDCSYYKDTPYTGVLENGEVEGEGNGCFGWLEEIKKSEESEMDGIVYMGPQIIDSDNLV